MQRKMKAYQLKAAIKNQKPAVWRRCIVPGGITYSQLSLILTEVMGRVEMADFTFEFYHRKIRFGESGEDRQMKPDYSYSVAEAWEFYIDELLDTEEWFSFYYGDQLKLRVTVEKRLEWDSDQGAYPFIVDVKEVVEEGSISESDMRENFQRVNEELKKKYAVRYGEPEYKTREQIQREHQKGNFGLAGWKKAENDARKIRNSGSHYFKLMGGILQKMTSQGEIMEELLSQEEQEFLAKARTIAEQKRMMEETKAQEAQNSQLSEISLEEPESQDDIGQNVQSENEKTKTERISLIERLLWENKDQLICLGKSLGLSGLSSLSKHRLAEIVVNRLLMKDVMEEYFIKQDERHISAWEAAVAEGSYHQPLAEHVPLLEKFYEDYYLAMYEDDSVEVPLSVAEKYKKINTPEFQDRRKRVTWMLACLHLHGMIYGAAPASVVMRMYRKKAGYRLKQSEFFTVFGDIPKEDNPCELCGDKVIKKSLLNNGYYTQIEKM